LSICNSCILTKDFRFIFVEDSKMIKFRRIIAMAAFGTVLLSLLPAGNNGVFIMQSGSVVGTAANAISSSPAIQKPMPMLFGIFMLNISSSLVKIADTNAAPTGAAFSSSTWYLNQFVPLKKVLSFASVTNNQVSGKTLTNAISTANHNSQAITYLAYDNEQSNGAMTTPSAEIQNPAHYTNTAADKVHSAGYKFVADPSHNILLSEYKSVDWTKVDMLQMQVERIAYSQSKFNSTVIPVAEYIRQHSANTTIMVQVDEYYATQSQIVQDIKGVRNMIDGVTIACHGGTGACNDTTLTSLFTALKSIDGG
jgi:hypothetical protein